VDEATIISEYSLEQAIEDGVLVEVFGYNIKDFVEQYTNGKPVVATAHLFSQVTDTDLTDVWNRYIEWKLNVKETLPEADQLFVTTMKGNKVYVVEDGQAITMMYPEDY
jgi:type I site-specific restriction endonuclease